MYALYHVDEVQACFTRRMNAGTSSSAGCVGVGRRRVPAGRSGIERHRERGRAGRRGHADAVPPGYRQPGSALTLQPRGVVLQIDRRLAAPPGTTAFDPGGRSRWRSRSA